MLYLYMVFKLYFINKDCIGKKKSVVLNNLYLLSKLKRHFPPNGIICKQLKGTQNVPNISGMNANIPINFMMRIIA